MLRCQIASAAACVTLAIGLRASAEEIPLKDALAPPITQEIAVAARSEMIAWVVRTAGAFEIKVADTPTSPPRVLVQGGGADSPPLSGLTLSPDGAILAYTYGESGAPNGRTPNPSSLTAGVDRHTFLIATGSGANHQAREISFDPVFAPDSRSLIWSEGGRVYSATVAATPDGGVALGERSKIFQDIGAVDDLAWSPNGQAIAFSSTRSGHSIIGVFRMGQEHFVWLNPSFESDISFAWSPDSHNIAFVRIKSRDYTHTNDVMTDKRFDIFNADSETGEAKKIFASTGDDGSAIADGPLLWSAAGDILFLSDASGYSQLYAISEHGGPTHQLTRGACDVETVALDAPRKRATVVSNCADVSRRDVSVVDLKTGHLSVVSSPNTIADASAFAGETPIVVYRSADAHTPQTPAVVAEGIAERRIDPPKLSPGVVAFRTPEWVRFKAADGATVTGVLFRPHRPLSKPGPAIVFVHGGPIREMMPGWHVSLYYALAYANNQHLADEGYTVLAVNYRLGVGFGKEFRNTSGYGPHGQRELQDVVAAGNFLRGLPDVDGKAIGIYGGSVGGYLTAASLARHSDIFAAGVAWSGIYDWTRWASNPSSDMIFTSWGVDAKNLDVAFSSSPIHQLDTWTSPTLLIAGDDDRNVYFPESIALSHALKDRGVDVETLLIPNGIHSFGSQENWLKVFNATDRFLQTKLGVHP